MPLTNRVNENALTRKVRALRLVPFRGAGEGASGQKAANRPQRSKLSDLTPGPALEFYWRRGLRRLSFRRFAGLRFCGYAP